MAKNFPQTSFSQVSDRSMIQTHVHLTRGSLSNGGGREEAQALPLKEGPPGLPEFLKRTLWHGWGAGPQQWGRSLPRDRLLWLSQRQ